MSASPLLHLGDRVPSGLSRGVLALASVYTGLPVTSELTRAYPLDGAREGSVSRVSRFVLGSELPRVVLFLEHGDGLVEVLARGSLAVTLRPRVPASPRVPVLDSIDSSRLHRALHGDDGSGPPFVPNAVLAEVTRGVEAALAGDPSPSTRGLLVSLPHLTARRESLGLALGPASSGETALRVVRDLAAGTPLEWALRHHLGAGR